MGKDNVRLVSQDTGQTAYHEADEGWKGKRVILQLGGRPTDCGEARIRLTEPFWQPGEEAVWLRAVRACPVSQYGHLDLYAYLREVGVVATGLMAGQPVQPMPRRGLSPRERDARLGVLRAQAKPDLPEWIEDHT
jgi:hypothetical protein